MPKNNNQTIKVMNKFFTVVCCACLAITGYFVTHDGGMMNDVSLKQNTVHAATIPSWNYNGQKPLDYLLDQAKRMKTDTVFIEVHDTVTVNNTKYVRVPVPEHTTDTLYIPMTDLPEIEVNSVKKPSLEDREEYTSGETRDGPKPLVILTIDGKMVYSSENDIHSGSSPQDSTSVPDKP